jgi:hypothetical protein
MSPNLLNPNWFATVALLLWPVIAFWLYRTRAVSQATLWTILGAELLLPAGVFIKLVSGIPQLDKVTIPNIAAFVGCMLCARRPLRYWNGFGLAEVLLLMSLVGPFITSELNGDVLHFGNLIVPGVGQYDAFSAVELELISLLPFVLGRQVLRSAADNADIFRVLVFAGLIYSLPMLFEIRMSPQLNNWVYGYHASAFDQATRDGGFRPMVFMGHGLGAAFFVMTTVVAAATLWRLQDRVLRLPQAAPTAYLGTLLFLCKSLAPMLYCGALIASIRWLKPRVQLRIASVLVIIALAYPLLRLADLVPTTAMVDAAEMVSADRAASLKTRFDQDQQLLERASQRLMFGWGRFGRSVIYDNYGRDISVTDGRWIITLGQFGLFGFLAEFGLLALPVFRAASALRFAESPADRILLAALALMLAVNIVDLLPNASLSPWTWLLAGALLGRAEGLHAVRYKQKARPPISQPGLLGNSIEQHVG